ncbi:MAG TPA: cell division protein ZapA [Deltaproteobacteria bacterium]|nr:cell division protein ZapA [Deltaproteobacteria bacterium]
MQIRITIRGRQYTVRGDEPAEEVQAVARDLDARLEEVASRTRSFDEYTVALLTALNLASELHQLRRRTLSELGEIDRDAAALEAMLQAMLPDKAAGEGSSDG